MLRKGDNNTETANSSRFITYLVISKCITAVIFLKVSRHYHRKSANSYTGYLDHTDVI
jgi:hypothetical protein